MGRLPFAGVFPASFARVDWLAPKPLDAGTRKSALGQDGCAAKGRMERLHEMPSRLQKFIRRRHPRQFRNIQQGFGFSLCVALTILGTVAPRWIGCGSKAIGGRSAGRRRGCGSGDAFPESPVAVPARPVPARHTGRASAKHHDAMLLRRRVPRRIREPFNVGVALEHTLKLLEQRVFAEVGEEAGGHGLMTKFRKVWPVFLTVSHKPCGLAGIVSRGGV